MTIDSEIVKSVVKVGAGRGFVIEAGNERLVVTAGHCLPQLPPSHPWATDERTYPNLLGQLGLVAPHVWAECVFVDPVADIAVLGSPDNQELSEEAEAFEEFIETNSFIRVGDGRSISHAWLLSLGGVWSRCTIRGSYGPIWIEDAPDGIHGGMCGSPIIADDGVAIGVVSVSGGRPNEVHTSGGPNPSLTHHLPGWLLREMIRIN